MRYTHIRLVHNKWSQPQGLYAGKETSTQIDVESMLAPRTGMQPSHYMIAVKSVQMLTSGGFRCLTGQSVSDTNSMKEALETRADRSWQAVYVVLSAAHHEARHDAYWVPGVGPHEHKHSCYQCSKMHL